MNAKLQTAKYVISDFVAATIAWSLFFIFRKISIEAGTFSDVNAVFKDRNFPVIRIYEIIDEEKYQFDVIKFPPRTLNWFTLRSLNDTEVHTEVFRKVFDSRNFNFVEKCNRTAVIEYDETSWEPAERYNYCKDWE